MNKLVSICILAILLSSCMTKQSENFARIKGTVISDSKTIAFAYFESNPAHPDANTQIAQIDSSGHFSIDIPISRINEGVIKFNQTRYSLVLMPGDQLELTIDGDSLQFKGTGAERNELLYLVGKVRKKDRNKIVLSWYRKEHTLEEMYQDVSDFLSTRQNEFDLFSKTNNLDPAFISLYEIQTKLYYIYLLDEAPKIFARKTKQDINNLQISKLANKYQSIASRLNDDFLVSGDYIHTFTNLIRKYSQERMKKDSTLNRNDAKLSVIMDSLSGKTREYSLALEIYYASTIRKKVAPNLLESFYEINTDDNCKKAVDALVAQNKAIKTLLNKPLHKDMQQTVLFDSKEKELTMADMLAKYKNKVVYIDIWAMGCGPCRMAMPASKKLKEELAGQDIELIYLTIDGKSDKLWSSVFKACQTEENHYRFANGFDSKLHKLLSINSVPTYLIIDKEGKLVSYNADRPYNPKLKEQLLKLAAK